MTVVDGYFDVRGVLRIYVNADYATFWPDDLVHRFTVVIELEGSGLLPESRWKELDNRAGDAVPDGPHTGEPVLGDVSGGNTNGGLRCG